MTTNTTTDENYADATDQERLGYLIDTADAIEDPWLRARRGEHIEIMREWIAEQAKVAGDVRDNPPA
jgi:hypothetical protein